jgi:hypothetical protein
MGILQQLETLLGTPKMFSPTSAPGFFPSLPAGQLPPVNPLLVLINDKSIPAPKFPLTIPAIKGLVESVGAGELHTLEGQILDAIKSPVDPANPLASLKKIFDGLNTLAENVATQVVTLITHQLVVGASLISSMRSSRRTSMRSSRHKASTSSATLMPLPRKLCRAMSLLQTRRLRRPNCLRRKRPRPQI